MHLRMDRMKTLRCLLLFTAFIYFVERGAEKICEPVSQLVTKTFDEGTSFVIAMNAENEQDRQAAELFQQSLDRRNRLQEKRFQWKRPEGRSLAERTDEFEITKDKNGKIIAAMTPKAHVTVVKND